MFPFKEAIYDYGWSVDKERRGIIIKCWGEKGCKSVKWTCYDSTPFTTWNRVANEVWSQKRHMNLFSTLLIQIISHTTHCTLLCSCFWDVRGTVLPT